MSRCISWLGRLPEPQRLHEQQEIHAYFEGEFVKQNLSRAGVPDIGPYKPCDCSIKQETRALLLNSLAQVEPLYQLEKEGAFKKGDPRGIAFADLRLAAGAAALRNMIVDAWKDSAQTPVGYARIFAGARFRCTRTLSHSRPGLASGSLRQQNSESAPLGGPQSRGAANILS